MARLHRRHLQASQWLSDPRSHHQSGRSDLRDHRAADRPLDAGLQAAPHGDDAVREEGAGHRRLQGEPHRHDGALHGDADARASASLAGTGPVQVLQARNRHHDEQLQSVLIDRADRALLLSAAHHRRVLRVPTAVLPGAQELLAGEVREGDPPAEQHDAVYSGGRGGEADYQQPASQGHHAGLGEAEIRPALPGDEEDQLDVWRRGDRQGGETPVSVGSQCHCSTTCAA